MGKELGWVFASSVLAVIWTTLNLTSYYDSSNHFPWTTFTTLQMSRWFEKCPAWSLSCDSNKPRRSAMQKLPWFESVADNGKRHDQCFYFQTPGRRWLTSCWPLATWHLCWWGTLWTFSACPVCFTPILSAGLELVSVLVSVTGQCSDWSVS